MKCKNKGKHIEIKMDAEVKINDDGNWELVKFWTGERWVATPKIETNEAELDFKGGAGLVKTYNYTDHLRHHLKELKCPICGKDIYISEKAEDFACKDINCPVGHGYNSYLRERYPLQKNNIPSFATEYKGEWIGGTLDTKGAIYHDLISKCENDHEKDTVGKLLYGIFCIDKHKNIKNGKYSIGGRRKSEVNIDDACDLSKKRKRRNT
jgi:hypothetical protein